MSNGVVRVAVPIVITGLLGLSVAMVVRGLSLHLDRVYVSSGSERAPLAGAFAAIALGLAVPRGFAAWMGRKARRRFARMGSSSDSAIEQSSAAAADRPLHWIVLSFLAFFVGLAALLLPAQIRAAVCVYDWAIRLMVWSEIPLEGLEALITLGAVLIPLGLLGMTVSCVHHIFSTAGGWDPRVTSWLLAGGGCGVWWQRSASEVIREPRVLFLAGALCAFLVSLLCGLAAGSAFAPVQEDLPGHRLPQWSDRKPGLLRAAVLVLGVAGVCATLLWVSLMRRDPSVLSTIIFFGAAAFLVGCSLGRRATGSLGGLGAATIATGVLLALGAVLAKLGASAQGSGLLLGAVVSCGGLAFASGYGWETLMSRVAVGSSEGCRTATRLLAGSTVSGWILVPLVANHAGEVLALVVLAVALVALGGILAAHEPAGFFRIRPLRLRTAVGFPR